jgi:hypothetical protein
MLGEPGNGFAVVHSILGRRIKIHAISKTRSFHGSVSGGIDIIVIDAKEEWIRSWHWAVGQGFDVQYGRSNGFRHFADFVEHEV